MDGWRVYVGESCLERAGDVDVVHQEWRSGRDSLAEQLKPYLDDTCPDCREQGTAAYKRLHKLPEGREFADEVDGDFYLLLRGDHPLGPAAVGGLVSLAQRG